MNRNRNLPHNYYHSVCEKDRRLGFTGEEKVKPFLDDYFDAQFIEDKTRWRSYDFIDTKKKIVLEMKTRRVSVDQYDTTCINIKKYYTMLKFLERGYTCYFIFKFTDGVYYFPVVESLPDSIEIREIRDTRRGCIELQKGLYIPTGLLVKMNFDKIYD